MDDQSFENLGIMARLAPGRNVWPDEHVHWQALGGAVDRARDACAGAFHKIAEISKNRDLSTEGKSRQCTKVCLDAIAELEADKAIIKARESVDLILKRWAEKQGAIIKKPSDMHEVALHQEIRRHVAGLNNKVSFIEKNKGDLMMLSAVLSAPSYLSGLSDVEFAAVKSMADSHLDPAIVQARAQTVQAMAECEHAWRRSVELIAEKGSLVRDASGAWTAPKPISKAA